MKRVSASALATLVTALVLCGCEGYDRRDAPLPAAGSFRIVSGELPTNVPLGDGAWLVVVWTPGSEETVRQLRELGPVRAELEGRGIRLATWSTESDESLTAKAAGFYGLDLPVLVSDEDPRVLLGVKDSTATVFIRDRRVVGAASGYRAGKFLRAHALELLSH